MKNITEFYERRSQLVGRVDESNNIVECKTQRVLLFAGWLRINVIKCESENNESFESTDTKTYCQLRESESSLWETLVLIKLFNYARIANIAR